MKEKKARVEDALNATRGRRRGRDPGGGVGFVRCIAAVAGLTLDGDEAIGATIVRRALEEPIRQLAYNAGAEGSIVVQKVKEASGITWPPTREDLMASGVVDPTKVALGAAERGKHRGADADDGSAHHRAAGKERQSRRSTSGRL